MSMNMVSEEELRAALRPFRAEASAFEAGVRARLVAGEKNRSNEPLARLSPLLRSAAAFLPLEVLAGCQGTAAAAKLGPAGGVSKLLGYLAFPAISLFVLLGATIFSVVKIRGIQDQAGTGLSDQAAIQTALGMWWKKHRIAAIVVFIVTMHLMLFGATWLLFAFYLVSFAILLAVLHSLARAGLGNRAVIGRTCSMGLMFLGQGAMMSGIGNREIHFVDQSVVAAVLYAGFLILLPFGISTGIGGRQFSNTAVLPKQKVPRWFWVFWAFFLVVQVLLMRGVFSIRGGQLPFRGLVLALMVVGGLIPIVAPYLRARMARQANGGVWKWGLMAFIAVLAIPLTGWQLAPVLWPATPARIKHYVESFASARFSTASWHHWEIAAQWAIDSGLDPDLTKPRGRVAKEIVGAQDPFILGMAFRVGLIEASDLPQLRNYDARKRLLLRNSPAGLPTRKLLHLGQQDWLIRAAVMRNELSEEDCDLLEQMLLAEMEGLATDPHVVLETPLRVTQLLEVIGRPIDRDKYRARVHELLRLFHRESGSWGQIAGGFKKYQRVSAGSVDATSDAVQLMEFYGVPEDLNLLWTRSFLRPLGRRKLSDEQWTAAATLARLDRLPGVTRPRWLEVLYYERTLLAAVALVGLCLYATASSPAGMKDEKGAVIGRTA